MELRAGRDRVETMEEEEEGEGVGTGVAPDEEEVKVEEREVEGERVGWIASLVESWVEGVGVVGLLKEEEEGEGDVRETGLTEDEAREEAGAEAER